MSINRHTHYHKIIREGKVVVDLETPMKEVRGKSSCYTTNLHSRERRIPRQGLTINWLGISEVVSFNPSNW